MRENNSVGRVVLRTWISDADIGYNADLDYALDQAAEGYFTVDQYGRIVTAAVLKRNETPEFTFYLTASDRGTPSLSSRTQVKVIINENNDDSRSDDDSTSDDRPEFEEVSFADHSYHIDILENVTVGTTVGRVQTTDAKPGEQYWRSS